MSKEAKRDKCGVRLDLIPPEVLLAVSEVFAKGAERYGEYNWQSSRLTGEHGPINHALKHILNYQAGIPDDDGPDPKIHLTHAIVNLMFEYWYEDNLQKPIKTSAGEELPKAAGTFAVPMCTCKSIGFGDKFTELADGSGIHDECGGLVVAEPVDRRKMSAYCKTCGILCLVWHDTGICKSCEDSPHD